jgi:hypothetical protein
MIMTEPERAALEHIRRVVDSIVGETTSASAPASNLLPVPYVSQVGDGASQFTNDSGAAAGAMLVRAYTGKVTTPDDFFNQTGQHADEPLSYTLISSALAANGVVVELRYSLKLGDLALVLATGRPAIVLVNHTVLEQAGVTSESFSGPHYLVAVGLDVKQVYIHDPLRADGSGTGQAIPWVTFYRAWNQAQGYQRAALIPRLQLVRRVLVTAVVSNVRTDPNVNASSVTVAHLGDVFEVTEQANGWGKVGAGMWINLSDTADI